MHDIIRYLHPTAIPLQDWTVVDSGNGARIARWDEATLGPAPEWDEQIGTYPALEAFRAAAEQAAAAAALPAITPRQLRMELFNRGLLANVEAAIASLPEPQKTGALIEWEYASQFIRAHPMVSAIAAAVGISSETLDDIFAAAAGI